MIAEKVTTTMPKNKQDHFKNKNDRAKIKPD